MPGRTDRRRRLIAVLIVFVVLAGSAGVRLAYWQLGQRDRLYELAQEQIQTQTIEPAQRGSIYDRTGTVLLATTAYRDWLIAYPQQIPDDRRAPVAAKIVAILGLQGADAAALTAKVTGDAGYVVLAKELTQAQSDAIRAGLRDGSLTELDLLSRPIRVYPSPGGAPNTTLASQLLGFVNVDNKGQYGVEQRYQALLGGQDRVALADQDVNGRIFTDTEQVTDAGIPGSDLRLTIDAGLQLAVERELNAAWVADGAESASAVVMDPYTGEVLAWASVPGYDANAYTAVATKDPSAFVDPIASQVYEPGSVMKMFTAAAAYEHKVVTPKTRINDSGTMMIGPDQIADADRIPMGWIPFQDVIAYSRNIGAARVAAMLGPTTKSASSVLYDMWERLGIGQPTGVDVSGEVSGLVTDPSISSWAPLDLANHSFGQGVATTLIQLARGYAAMMNGGLLVEPHVVAGVGAAPASVPTAERAISAGLSSQLVTLMRHVVTSVPWYAQGTLIPGYDVGGKTGTAQIWDSTRGTWLSNQFNFTFVGYLGRDKPEYVIAVLINHGRPKIVAQGVFQQSITSYELFRRIARDTIGALDLAPLPKGSGKGSTPAASHAPGGSSTRGADELPARTPAP